MPEGDEYANVWGPRTASDPAAFDVVLEAVGRRKIAVIREIRAAARLDLKAAKDVADSPPSVVAAAVSRDRAEALRGTLERAGATVSLQPAEGAPRERPAAPAAGHGASGVGVVLRAVLVLGGVALLAAGYRTLDRTTGWGVALFVLGLSSLVLAASVGRSRL